jgi:hypothetical protein
MVISVILPTSENTIQAFSSIKVWNFLSNIPTSTMFILGIGNILVLLFDWLLSLNNSLIGFYTDLLNIVYFCPNLHFINEYATDTLFFYPWVDLFPQSLESKSLEEQSIYLAENFFLNLGHNDPQYLELTNPIGEVEFVYPMVENSRYIFLQDLETWEINVLDLYYWENIKLYKSL